MLKSAVLAHAFGQHLLARMPKGRMPEIMGQRDRFRQILVQSQRARDRPANRGHFESMRQPGAQMVRRSIKKNLRFVLEPAKRARMNDSCAVALEFRAVFVSRFGEFPATRVARLLCKGRECSARRPPSVRAVSSRQAAAQPLRRSR